MKPFSRILCAVDFSSVTEEVVSRAFGIGAHGPVAVHLCHILQSDVPNPMYAHYTKAKDADAQALAMAEAKAALEQLVPANIETEDAVVEFHTPAGDPVIEVTRLAEEVRADVIVMGTHGRSGLKHLLLGSVAEGVIQGSRCPVLVIKEHTRKS